MIVGKRIQVALVCLAMFGTAVHGQPYPSRPIRLIVSTAPGSGSDIIARINQELARTVSSPDIREKLLAAGAEPSMSSPEDFTAFLVRESKRLVKLLADAGVNAK